MSISTTRNTSGLAAVFLATLGLGCGPQAGDGGASPSGSSEASAVAMSGSNSAKDSSEACAAPNLMCDGECIDPMTDPDNCRVCGGWCRVVRPGENASPGECQQGICEPTFSDGGCISKAGVAGELMTSCADICETRGNTCVDNGCDGGTILWEPAYQECTQSFDCVNPDGNVCEGLDEAEQALHQPLGCDVVFEDAFAMSGLPPAPEEKTEGPYVGYERFWTARCCCQG